MAFQSKKWHTMAAGWLRDKADGTQYVSAVANGPKSKVKLYAELETGETVPVSSFAMFFNDDSEKKSEKSPDVRFTFTTEG